MELEETPLGEDFADEFDFDLDEATSLCAEVEFIMLYLRRHGEEDIDPRS